MAGRSCGAKSSRKERDTPTLLPQLADPTNGATAAVGNSEIDSENDSAPDSATHPRPHSATRCRPRLSCGPLDQDVCRGSRGPCGGPSIRPESVLPHGERERDSGSVSHRRLSARNRALSNGTLHHATPARCLGRSPECTRRWFGSLRGAATLRSAFASRRTIIARAREPRRISARLSFARLGQIRRCDVHPLRRRSRLFRRRRVPANDRQVLAMRRKDRR